MTTEQLQAEMKYSLSKSMLKRMLEQGLLTAEEYAKADRKLSRIYRPVLAGLYAPKP